MKIKRTILVAILVILLGPAVQFCKAQADGDWQLLGITTTRDFKGIEGYYKLSACNGATVVLLKLVNNNNYTVRAGWRDVVFTTDGQRLRSKGVQDSITLAPNSETKGDCTGGAPQLLIKLSDFGIEGTYLGRFTVAKFDFIRIN